MIGTLGNLLFFGTFAMTTNVAAQSQEAFAVALDRQWDYGKPAVSEQRFRAEVAKWPPDSAQADEAWTQVARALGLQRKFDAAHAVLTRDARTTTGNFFLDEAVLAEEGVRDLSRYAVKPGAPLLPDLFLD